MNILDKILADKYKEVEQAKEQYPVSVLEKSVYFLQTCVSLKESLLGKDTRGIIAEIKRKSPSQGVIHPDVDVVKISTGYVSAGATALSILTDYKYFGGTQEDLLRARELNDCPVLRKDFMVDEYQVVEAKAMGADVILLIAAALKPNDIKHLTSFAHSFGLEVLLEVHDANELENNLESGADIIGVNNRNLKTFEVSLDTSLRLLPLIPSSVVKISESGIDSPEALLMLKKAGFQGFLMGQNFMKHSSPEEACRLFIESIKVHS
ncbi:MAG: indole-3-glycerol phosphate synthase TrpC [Cyclobacteriaceae bacterium]|nr:indole-3-glycerol phosphate synthase TrpC [Cyclobacteriaceae bacterium]UYN85665.1 MAG: indole-3-glycerol phosphate synthase TrpC [Cyclobacteriaceae bacterium]